MFSFAVNQQTVIGWHFDIMAWNQCCHIRQHVQFINISDTHLRCPAAQLKVKRCVTAGSMPAAITEWTVDDQQATRFEVAGNELKLKAGVSLDHETESQVALNVTATDSGGLTFTESFVIPVGDTNEAPEAIGIGSSKSTPLGLLAIR